MILRLGEEESLVVVGGIVVGTLYKGRKECGNKKRQGEWSTLSALSC